MATNCKRRTFSVQFHKGFRRGFLLPVVTCEISCCLQHANRFLRHLASQRLLPLVTSNGGDCKSKLLTCFFQGHTLEPSFCLCLLQVLGMPASDHCVRPPATTATVEACIHLSASAQVTLLIPPNSFDNVCTWCNVRSFICFL